jgi:hypothetical protein
VDAPDVRYARSGDVSIAYSVVGEGPFDLVYVAGWVVSSLEQAWDGPFGACFTYTTGSSVGSSFDTGGASSTPPATGSSRASMDRCGPFGRLCDRGRRDAVRNPGSSGLHTGECEVVDGKVGGIAVHIGARVTAEACPSEVLVSSTVRDLVAGSGIQFLDRGSAQLKGVPGEWRIYAVRPETVTT